ncbi:MAG: DUF1343 domain-containing protein [Ignavibacteriales bacterium]|nr:DUF1343 domain-containing protein [Ignavibacteriales bacterium]
MIRGFVAAALCVVALWAQTDPVVKTGVEVLRESGFETLDGKKVGLVTNPTGVDRELVSTVDILDDAPNVELVALYGPEHGVRGEYAAGEHVDTYVDEKTGVTVFSLYGKNRKPPAEMLEGIDVLVFDIQDIGCRSYTYISTMGLAMEACAEQGVPFVVLDRPNPIGGLNVEGNLVEDGFISFVSQFKIPYVHGLTVGELARMLNDEGMLAEGVTCDLSVVPMEGWTRDMTFTETGLPWVPSSPHVPFKETATHYVTTGILGELGVISEGVGYTIPFHTFAAEWIDGQKLTDRLNALNLEGVRFRPITFKPYYGRHKGVLLHGAQVFLTDPSKVHLTSLQFRFMEVHHEMYPDKNPFELCDPSRIGMFDKVCGTDKVRKMFSERMKYEDVADFLRKDEAAFTELSKKYYLYD